MRVPPCVFRPPQKEKSGPCSAPNPTGPNRTRNHPRGRRLCATARTSPRHSRRSRRAWRSAPPPHPPSPPLHSTSPPRQRPSLTPSFRISSGARLAVGAGLVGRAEAACESSAHDHHSRLAWNSYCNITILIMKSIPARNCHRRWTSGHCRARASWAPWRCWAASRSRT